jgi:hypothetical protein
MLGSSCSQLPYGAKGFDIGEAVLVFVNDKLVIAPTAERYHVTVHFGSKSGKLDIHETRTAADGSKNYTTLFEISHSNLALMLQEIAIPTLVALRGIVRPLRPGWMAKRRVGAIVGLMPAESDLLAITKMRSHKLVFDPDKITAQIRAPEFLEDLYDLSDGQTFTLFAYKNLSRPRRIGFGFKFTDPTGRRRLFWIRERQMGEALKYVGTLLEVAAVKYGTFYKALPW